MIKLIIFDWDDVFTLGAKDGYIKCLHDTLLDLNIHLDPDEEMRRIQQTWGKPHEEDFKNLLREEPQLVAKACKIYEKKLFGNTFVNSLKLVKGSIEFIDELSKKYILAVATGAHPKILERIIKKFLVPNVFAQIISGYEIDDTEKQKPHPYMLEEIMSEQKINPSETIFVGDAKSDVLMAKAAGVLPVVVLTGHLSRKEAEKLKVENVISDVTHLEDILKSQ